MKQQHKHKKTNVAQAIVWPIYSLYNAEYPQQHLTVICTTVCVIRGMQTKTDRNARTRTYIRLHCELSVLANVNVAKLNSLGEGCSKSGRLWCQQFSK